MADLGKGKDIEAPVAPVVAEAPKDSDGDGVSDQKELSDGTDPNDLCDFIYSISR